MHRLTMYTPHRLGQAIESALLHILDLAEGTSTKIRLEEEKRVGPRMTQADTTPPK